MRDDHFVIFRQSNGFYYYYVYRYGKRIKRSTGEKRKADALQVVLERRDAHDLLNERKKTSWQTFREFAEPFFDYDRCPIIQDKVGRGGHYSRQMADTNRRNVQKYLIPVFGSKVLEEISAAMVNQWLLSLPDKFGITPQTASYQLVMLRQMLDVAVSQGIIRENPTRAVKPLFAKRKERGCYSQEEVSRIFSSPWTDTLCEYACRLSSLTGMRLGEVRGLRISRVYSDYILLDTSWSDMEGLKTTKSGKSRKVPIPQEFSEQLHSLPLVSDLIFTYDGNQPFAKSTVLNKLKERMTEVGIDWKKENLGFHSFRHFFNTRLLAMGVDEAKVRSIIGHESKQMTDLYAHLSAEDLKQIRIVQESIA